MVFLRYLVKQIKMENDRKRGNRKVSALVAASMGRSAVAAVRHHTHASFDMTGTNVSYEGATAPGAGGSVGNGYASGQEALDASLRIISDFEVLHKRHISDENPDDKGADLDQGSSC